MTTNVSSNRGIVFGNVAGMSQFNMLGNEIVCEIISTESGTLNAGNFVKLAGITNGILYVELAGDGENAFGMMVHSAKRQDYVAGDKITVARDNGAYFATASAAIVQGASLKVSGSGLKVVTRSTTGEHIGIALGSAAADGDLVLIEPDKSRLILDTDT